MQNAVPSPIEVPNANAVPLPQAPLPSRASFHNGNVSETSHVNGTPFAVEAPEYPFDLCLDQSGSIDPFAQDFSMFMDSVPSTAYPFSLTHQPLPVFSATSTSPSVFAWQGTSTQNDSPHSEKRATAAITIPFSETSPSVGIATESSLSRYGSRLPSLAPEDRPPRGHSGVQTSPRQHSGDLFVSVDCRQHILEELAKFPNCVDSSFVLPSRHALSRLITGYFQNFHDHYPVFHVPTLMLETLNVELLLSITALGARYTMEVELGVELYRVARSVALARISNNQENKDSVFQGVAELDIFRSHSERSTSNSEPSSTVQMMQTLLLLIAMSSWHKHEPAAADALSIRSVLHSIVQDCGKALPPEPVVDDWKSWIQMETVKRTHLVIFCFFNIHTILFDLPPMMLTNELMLDLPCSEKEWKACTEQKWREACSETGNVRLDFRDAYSSLFTCNHRPKVSARLKTEGFSALGGYALIHAVIQQIWLVRNGRMPTDEHDGNSLSKNEMKTFERALKRWTSFWELNKESSMDPLNPHGPLPFTSTALLRLAYIRLNMDLGPVRALNSWDPHVVASCLHQSPGAQRGDQMTRAALHCAHALSIPVKLGINYVARTQMIHWSNQHALCSLECAVLLAKWLESVTGQSAADSTTLAEQRVLEFTAQLVAEAKYKTSYESLLEQRTKLSSLVVRLWAELYQSKCVWQTVNLIGQSLNIYADLLEQDHT